MTWPRLMKHWIRVDEKMKTYDYPKKLDLKLKLTMIILLLIASVEYSLALIHNAIDYNGITITFQNWEFFIKKQFPLVFSVTNYSLWKSIILLIVSTTATFLWSYADLFVMLCSFVLAARFKQITERLDKIDFQVKNELFWRSIREDYVRLAQLCRHLDDTISNVLLLSYSSNLSFIIYQLFNSIKKLLPLEKTYFYFSFSFLIARTIALSLYGASINDESKEPIRILNSVPSSAYNGEIKRFLLHLKMDSVALTGHKLFKLTRGFILSIAATIVTYELVLIQFNQATLEEYRNNETKDICYS
ncbi:gustatory receptor for sugar taste 64f-like [Agrilus planipennis]|uniref:Gustatory receptor for sugar taste 64f-like n=1 Tax=Agrilus planipennis TaxID=224129 RepID=A0A1W4WHQ3_AGRPL|nr:gustatory receptor for sugar taste 64f-like [Agrilus planipennis]